MNFKTERLRTGGNEVDKIFELADILGYDIIRLNSKQIGYSTSAVFGFDVPVMAYNFGGPGVASVDRGYVYFYPDGTGVKWGFCIDTPHNRAVIASHYAAPEFKPTDVKMQRIIEDLCLELGFGITPVNEANPYIQKSDATKRDEHKVSELKAEEEILARKLAALKKELEDTASALERKKTFHEHNDHYSVEEVQVNDDGEPEIIEVKAVTPRVAKNVPAVNKKRVAKKITKG